MNAEIKFPYHGSFTAKRSGYTWNYEVYDTGMVAYMERYAYVPITRRSTQDRRVKVVCGGDRSTSYMSRVITKECLDDIEKKLGRKTDGWHWITDEEQKAEQEYNDKLIKEYPIDGSYRMMEKTEFRCRAFNDRDSRIVYRHKPTGNLYWNEDGWRRTSEAYCYNVRTGERGKYWR